MERPPALTETTLEGIPLLRRGKVRDIYQLDHRLLIVATDRISAFDSVLGSGIPLKGRVLTGLSLFWFRTLDNASDNHLITGDVEDMGDAVAPHVDLLRGRSMLVRKADVVPVECVVRGYLAGSGWREYQQTGACCGIALPADLLEGSELPEPIFTPAIKAESGHDENITFEQACDLHGEELMTELRDHSIALYQEAAHYAAGRGILIADTKFEWGRVDDGLILIDEILTPDSSRFWPADQHEPGRAQPSFDKQYVRDWLETQSGWDKEPPAPPLPDHVVEKTVEKYLEAYRNLTGQTDLS
ncbi:MAG: phosphoribosylaminoimidazolesuccinocarboxamide synthase [Planctomycetota bacterium]